MMHMKPILHSITLWDGCGPPVTADGVVIHNYTTTFGLLHITDGIIQNVLLLWARARARARAQYSSYHNNNTQLTIE